MFFFIKDMGRIQVKHFLVFVPVTRPAFYANRQASASSVNLLTCASDLLIKALLVEEVVRKVYYIY